MAGTSETLRTDLADAGNAANGSGQVGWGPGVSYTTGVGSILRYFFGTTAAEGSAAVTPTNYGYPELHLFRYGGVADGTFTAGGSAGGTNNLSAMTSALSVAAIKGGIVTVPAGVYNFSAGFTIPRGVIIRGSGKIHLPFFLAGQRRGTVLMVAGGASANCVTFEENYGHCGLEEISVFNSTTNSVNAVILIKGHLHPIMRNVEYGSLRKSAGGGLVLDNGATTSTLYGQFHDITCTMTDVGTGNEASIGTGLVINGAAIAPGPANANHFFGGVIAGRIRAFLQQSAGGAGTGPLNSSFHGTLFEGVYNTDMDHDYVALSAGIVGLDDGTTNRYIVKLLEIQQGFDTNFNGCYFELGGIPANYNDGSNGVAALVGTVSVINTSDTKRTQFRSSNWNSVFPYDNGVDTVIELTYDGFRYGSAEQPNTVVRNAASQVITHNTDTTLQFATVLNGDTGYCKWDSGNYQVVIKQQGSYLISGAVTMVGWNTANTYTRAKIVTTQGNFVSYLGQQGTAIPISVPITGLIKLNRGDTIKLNVLHTQGGNQNTSAGADESFLSVVKVG